LVHQTKPSPPLKAANNTGLQKNSETTTSVPGSSAPPFSSGPTGHLVNQMVEQMLIDNKKNLKLSFLPNF
jgi:hypothetical protein